MVQCTFEVHSPTIHFMAVTSAGGSRLGIWAKAVVVRLKMTHKIALFILFFSPAGRPFRREPAARGQDTAPEQGGNPPNQVLSASYDSERRSRNALASAGLTPDTRLGTGTQEAI